MFTKIALNLVQYQLILKQLILKQLILKQLILKQLILARQKQIVIISSKISVDDQPSPTVKVGQTIIYKETFKRLKHNRITSGELLSNDWRAVGFVNSKPWFSVVRVLYPVSEYESQMSQTKNQPSEKLHKRQTGLIYLL